MNRTTRRFSLHSARYWQRARLALCLRSAKCSDHKPTGAIPASLSSAAMHMASCSTIANECSDTLGELVPSLPTSAAHVQQECSVCSACVHRCPAMLALFSEHHCVPLASMRTWYGLMRTHSTQKGVTHDGSCA